MLIRRAGLAVGVTLLAVLGSPAVAASAPPVECARKDPLTGVCLIVAATTGSDDGVGADGDVVPVSTGSGGTAETAPPDPCTYGPATPQPPESHPVWQGRTAADGSVYLQVCPRPDGYGSGYRTDLVFVASGTDPPAGPAIDPRVLAEQAISAMELSAPQIRMAPPPGSTSGLVGLPVWMWTERTGATVGPVEQSASAGGLTVTAVGRLSRIVWDMGDGTTVSCGAGTPYPPGAEGESPDCGHVYAQASSRHVPGGAWPVTATSTWTITWSGGGLSGTETLELSATADLVVGELHVLNQDGGSR
ncbi:hypothetical protein [Geodermatophilus obscurus]|uniref:Putative ATP/GTP-binding protein n=1 Tax=Geodermatophilus obscurus (strain ATCC 25078 / DSM 43160 / JCM 3152 / CCUG 61914 / KCC A-0152 / KCTC 9177 / NBRC 13315 / NRRL B-3577 / G-20) TaxID=526225 RepID=D2S7E5_GEOOG|nr:hypothetical protein [Geodermatophilus obscurus]ADB73445.1 putative ATP/GTP-binding protein [Geodermatophilus obscurus DSM 43160]